MQINNQYTIPWDKNLNTDVKWIDEQHQLLLKKIEDMLNALIQKKCEKKVLSFLSFLRDYVHMHFNVEEKYMQRYNYPDYSDHYKQHREFNNRLKMHEDQYAVHGAGRGLAIKIERELWDWYKTHICNYDKKLAVFLKLNKAPKKLA